ncbi:MAG: hypothetical protein IH946_05340, partial [Bacteroidetes bacterium]|nr:hypothetical protein [Bacteroidota bacterium]
ALINIPIGLSNKLDATENKKLQLTSVQFGHQLQYIHTYGFSTWELLPIKAYEILISGITVGINTLKYNLSRKKFYLAYFAGRISKASSWIYSPTYSGVGLFIYGKQFHPKLGIHVGGLFTSNSMLPMPWPILGMSYNPVPGISIRFTLPYSAKLEFQVGNNVDLITLAYPQGVNFMNFKTHRRAYSSYRPNDSGFEEAFIGYLQSSVNIGEQIRLWLNNQFAIILETGLSVRSRETLTVNYWDHQYNGIYNSIEQDFITGPLTTVYGRIQLKYRIGNSQKSSINYIQNINLNDFDIQDILIEEYEEE